MPICFILRFFCLDKDVQFLHTVFGFTSNTNKQELKMKQLKQDIFWHLFVVGLICFVLGCAAGERMGDRNAKTIAEAKR